MEARDLEYFVVVAEVGNLRRAAETLNLSQPALSKSLRRLEQSAGTKLVKRTPKGVELTPVGVALLSHARRIRLSFDEIARELTDFTQGHAGQLRIGSAPVLLRQLLSPACIQLHKESPKVKMYISIASNDQLLPSLRRGELDVVICGIPAQPYEDLIQERLYEDNFIVYASKAHRLAGKKRVAIRDLVNEKWALMHSGTFARKKLQQALEDNGAGPLRVVMESAALAPRLDLVASSDVLGFSPWRNIRDFSARLGLIKLHVSGLHSTNIIGVSYRRDTHQFPLARRFVEIVKKKARDAADK